MRHRNDKYLAKAIALGSARTSRQSGASCIIVNRKELMFTRKNRLRRCSGAEAAAGAFLHALAQISKRRVKEKNRLAAKVTCTVRGCAT